MKTFFDDRQRAHDPKHFLSSGTRRPNPEQPARIDALLGAVRRLGFDLEQPADHGIGPIAAIHSPEYLDFLQTIHSRWQRIAGASEEVIPNIHPGSRTDSYPRSAIGQAGWHQADTACPISAETWGSVYRSAQSAIAAARAVIGGTRAAYALCRPPGHHAFRDRAGGFCFVNNTAVAAEEVRRAGLRPAILDIDLHHGNGTQGIFYARGDVLTVSIHADPEGYYPFFWGHAHERGEGLGRGANLNLPIPQGTRDDGFIEVLDIGLARVAAFGPDVLLVALGLDPFAGDPFGGLAVTTPGFARIGERLARAALPTIVVQEGGYLCPELGDNLARFMTGFEAAHG